MSTDGLLNFHDHVEVIADGVADVRIRSSQLQAVLFKWQLFDGVWQRVVCATIRRPVEPWEGVMLDQMGLHYRAKLLDSVSPLH